MLRPTTSSGSGRRSSGESGGTPAAPAGGEVADLDIGESLALLGDRALVEYANLDGHLYAVSVIACRSVLHDLGPADGLAAHIDSCAFTLHRLNRTQGSTASRAAACRAG